MPEDIIGTPPAPTVSSIVLITTDRQTDRHTERWQYHANGWSNCVQQYDRLKTVVSTSKWWHGYRRSALRIYVKLLSIKIDLRAGSLYASALLLRFSPNDDKTFAANKQLTIAVNYIHSFLYILLWPYNILNQLFWYFTIRQPFSFAVQLFIKPFNRDS